MATPSPAASPGPAAPLAPLVFVPPRVSPSVRFLLLVLLEFLFPSLVLLTLHSSVSLTPSGGDPLQATEPILYSLMTGIAHDIRNPLGMILSSLELILDQGHENVFIQEYGDSIRRSILRLKNSTSRLLDYGRTYQYVPFDSVDLISMLLTKERV